MMLGESELERVGKSELSEEGENPNFAPTTLGELIEDIQFGIFLAMCLYVLVGLYIAMSIARKRRIWTETDQMKYSTFKWKVANNTVGKSIVRYWALRQRFLNPPSLLRYKTKHPDSFPFHAYIYKCHVQLLTSLVAINAPTWISSWFIVLLTYPLLQVADKELTTYIVTGLSVLVLITLFLLWEQTSNAVEQITPSVVRTKECILQSNTLEQALSSMPEEVPLDSRLHIVNNVSFFGSDEDAVADESAAPLVAAEEPTVAAVSGEGAGHPIHPVGASKSVGVLGIRNVQDSLLLFGHTNYVRNLMQLLMFLQVAGLAFSATRLFNPYWERDMPNWNDKAVLVLPGALSLLSFLLIWPNLVTNVTFITSLEFRVKGDVVHELDDQITVAKYRDRKTLIAIMKTIPYLSYLDDEVEELRHYREFDLFAAMPQVQREQLMTLHKLMQHSGRNNDRNPGSASGVGDVWNLARSGCHGSRVAQVLNVPDSCLSLFNNAGNLTEQQFIGGMVALAYGHHPTGDDKNTQIAQSLFDIVDTDHDGYISDRDLMDALQHQPVQIQPETVRLWFTEELLVTDAGYTDKETFVEVLKDTLRPKTTSH
ncbi:putative transmembrane protein [Gregarina niphandrodes]|uniref:Transmembrane protein n=1 Tax=Gregarina niphandrodes TaxID=110365 RepID=A0A023B6W1_GRENI|nr:putative transmembrane protein [Gregarina niphandrodes]EZG66815.1 putative transmembrane protein [Gregarina niphandrodes]|eukprot:XP_011130474.1 putative transmembrane protein [Gregarina niphandrodes]